MPSTNPCTLHPPSFLERFAPNNAKSDPSKDVFAPPPLTAPADLPPSSTYRFLNAICSLERSKEDLAQVQAEKLKTVRSRLDDHSKTHLEELKTNAEALQSNYFWSFLKKVASSLLAALSLITGFTLATNAATAAAGGALIASGILSIAHTALTESKGWDWITDAMQIENQETKEKVRKYLPTVCGMLAAGCALVGSVEAITSNAFHFSEKAASIAQTAITLFAATTQIGKGLSDARLEFTQAKLHASGQAIETTNAQLQLVNRFFENILSNFDYIFKHARRAMQSIIKAHHFY